MFMMFTSVSHIGQFPLAPLCEQARQVMQKGPPLVSSLRKVRWLPFPAQMRGLGHACLQR